MKKKYSAFSLIELSIVILIIGVLIAGVTQASRLVRQSKLTTARTLTQSSAVNSIKGLLLWLEPTMDNSFKSSETTDANPITTWYDINPQVSLPNTFTSNSSSTLLINILALLMLCRRLHSLLVILVSLVQLILMLLSVRTQFS